MSVSTGVSENCGEFADLVVGNFLPPSSIDAKYLKVERNKHIVYHDSIPKTAPMLQDLDAPEWKDTKFIQDTFTTPATGRQRNPQKMKIVLPYCALFFGDGATSLRERLIRINCWLNMSRKEQKDKTELYKRYFLKHTKSTELRNKHDPSKPKYVGIGDKQELRQERVEASQSYKKIEGGRKQKARRDPPRTNCQLRDFAVKVPESRMQVLLHQTMRRSTVQPEDAEVVQGKFEPVIMTTSSVYTPTKGRPPSFDVRRKEKVQYFGRDRGALAFSFEPLARALRANPAAAATLSGNDIVDILEQEEETSFHFMDDKDNWPGTKYLKKRDTDGPIVPIEQRRTANADRATTPELASEDEGFTGDDLDEYFGYQT